MKRDCPDYWEAILDLAEGKANEDASEHLQSCVACQQKLSQATKLVGALRLKQEDAPNDLVEWAKGLMPAQPRFTMRLLRTTLALSGARSGTADFQSVYETEGIQMRVLYSKQSEGWEVISKVPDQAWAVSRHGTPVETDPEGRFKFAVNELAETGFEVESGNMLLIVPSGTEAVGADQRDS